MTKTEVARRMDEISRLMDDICDGQDGACRECPFHRMAAGQENLCAYFQKAMNKARHAAQEEQRAKSGEGRR